MTALSQQPTVLDAALAFADAGCSVIPVATDGTKRPLGQWKQAQTTPPTRAQVEQAFAGGHPGLGIVTGAVSGNLLMVELEGRAVAEGMLGQLRELAFASGLGDLWRRATGGYMEATPSGGVHLLVRVLAPVGGNEKLARRPGPPDPVTGKPTVEVLAETRGEGGFVVVAPSHGPVHPTGKAWQRAAGGPDTIPDLTADEAALLLDLFRGFDQMPQPAPLPPRPPADAPRSAADTFLLRGGATPAGGISPGDDFNAKADWAQILEPHGWRLMRESSAGERFWLRPGKQPAGRDDCSATTGYGDRGDWLWVFSTSTEFETETTYSKFAAYALLEHAGDYSAAARRLRQDGYGTPPPEPPRPAQAATAQPGPGASTPTSTTAKDVHDAALPPDVPAPPAGPLTYSRTDDGNALRLVDGHQQELRYVPQRGQWLAWDGHRWRWDDAGRVHEHARSLARALPVGTKEDDKHRAWSLSARGLTAMVRTAQTDGRIATSIADLDRRPYELNTPAGVIDLRTGQLRAPDPDALHTRSTAVAPSQDEPTRWLRFLADTFAADPAITLYVQRLLGVSLIGEVLEQLLPFGFGEGANGKTTLLGVVMRIVGLGEDGYSLGAPAELLLASANAGHPTELARLAGARIVVTSELEEGQRFAEAKVKQLTGRDPVTARFMRQDFFTFTPTHSLWLLANHAPAVRAGGPAFWRRLRLLPFLHVVPPEQRDPHLEDRLVDDEGPAILGWLVQGAVDYLAHGLAEPAAVRAATAEYEKDQDTVARFVDEQCVLGPAGQQGMAVKVADLRTAYESWCRVEGETPVSAKAFTLTLCSRFGVSRDRDMATRYYAGIRLDGSSDLSSDSGVEDQSGWWQQ